MTSHLSRYISSSQRNKEAELKIDRNKLNTLGVILKFGVEDGNKPSNSFINNHIHLNTICILKNRYKLPSIKIPLQNKYDTMKIDNSEIKIKV